MNYLPIILVAAAVIIFIIILNIINNLIKALVYFAILMAIISVVFGFFVVKDYIDFTSKMSDHEKLFILKEGDKFISGVTFIQVNQTKALSAPALADLSKQYADADYESMLDNRSMFMIFDIDSLSQKNETLRKMLAVTSDSDKEVRAAAFAFFVVSKLRKDPLYLVKAYRDEEVVVYPESVTLKTIRLLGR